MVDASWQYLPFRQGDRSIHLVDPQVLDQPVLPGPIVLLLRDVAERGRMDPIAHQLVSRLGRREQVAEALVHLFLQ